MRRRRETCGSSSQLICHPVHGLAGTNRFLYDVYTRVAELDLRGIGLGTEWEEMRPQLTEETWQGTLRSYWTLDSFRIPLCRMNVF